MVQTPNINGPSSDSETAGFSSDVPPSSAADVASSTRSSVHSAAGASATTQGPSTEVHPSSDSAMPGPTRWWNTKAFRIGLTLVMLIIVTVVITRAIKPGQIADAFTHVNPWWFAAALAVGTLGWVGSAIPLRVFSPVPIPFKDAFLLQVASSFVGVAAPDGIGSLALSIRFLCSRGVAASQATATMVLVGMSQALTSIILVLVGVFVLGVDPKIKIPWQIVGWVVLAVIVVALAIFAIPKARAWVITSVISVWKKVYPQAIWAFHHPKNLLTAMGGAVILSSSFIFALWFSLLAFGQHTNLLKLAAVFLVFNTLGAAIPVPGGDWHRGRCADRRAGNPGDFQRGFSLRRPDIPPVYLLYSDSDWCHCLHAPRKAGSGVGTAPTLRTVVLNPPNRDRSHE